MISTRPRKEKVLRLYEDAGRLLRDARGGLPAYAVQSETARILEGFEVWFDGQVGDDANRSLRRWSRDMLGRRFVMASVHLGRAGLVLGLRASEAKRRLGRHAAPPVKEAPRAIQEADGLAGLSEAERDLVRRLPGSSAALRGAAALAECWGGTMSPTSARGRYSRLATKLEKQAGLPILMRGGGCYGRLDA